MASLERFAAACFRSGERCALACASLAYGGSLAYGARGGAALCEASKEPPKEAAPPEPEHGGERYLAYSASLARLKVVLLKTKLALAKTTLAKGAALKTAAAGKAAAVKTAAAEGARYVAYSSDVGESMRPVLKPWMVNATYGIAVGYVGYDAYAEVRRKADLGHGNDVLLATCAHKLVFHAAVSLALPAVIIHSAVHRSHALFAKETFAHLPRLVKFGPSAVGLGLIPFMPLFDEPAEHVLEAAFDRVWPASVSYTHLRAHETDS